MKKTTVKKQKKKKGVKKRVMSISEPVTAEDVKSMLRKYADKKKIGVLSSFFKTGKGQYGEGDVFIGVTVPQTRKVAQSAISLEFTEISKLLKEPVHEYRLCGLLILAYTIDRLYGAEYKKALKSKDAVKLRSTEMYHKQIADFYLSHLLYVNNWDLVDQSAHHILGSYIFRYQRAKVMDFLKHFALSQNLWVRRVAMIATFYGIQELKALDEVFAIAKILLHDPQDLIQKAVGWMLREAGKRDEQRLKKFLELHAASMPRTALRYAIERLGQRDKVRFMKMGK